MKRNHSMVSASILFAATLSLCANSLAFSAEATQNAASTPASDVKNQSKNYPASSGSSASAGIPGSASGSPASTTTSSNQPKNSITNGTPGSARFASQTRTRYARTGPHYEASCSLPASTPTIPNPAKEPKTSSSTPGSAGVLPAFTPTSSSATTPGDSTGSLPTTIFGAKPKWRPGMELDASTNAEDLVPTDDVELAKKQVEAYPDSPEASFILAVALTRTSRVEDALKQVRNARKLAEQKGGTDYFDKMIATYEALLKNYPNENRVRYGLAWAYYMKAYLVANYSRRVAAWKAKNGDPAAVLAASGNDPARAIAKAKAELASQQTAQAQANGSASNGSTTGGADAKTIDAAKAALQSATKPGKPVDVNNILAAAGALAQGNSAALPKIPSVMDNVDPSDVPKIKQYYELALSKLDDLLAQKPDDVWALVYRAHLRAEYTGNIDDAMKTWKACSEKFPNNPAAYFFLGEGFLKQGNLKESLNNVSKAVALRAVGN